MLTFWGRHIQALKNSLAFFKGKIGSTAITVLAIAVTLTLPSLFWVLTHHLKQATTEWHKNGHISLYLSVSVLSKEVEQLIQQVQATPGVKKITYKSATDGLIELQQQEGMKDIMNYLPENPLPAVIEVEPSTSIATPAQLETLFQQLQAYPQVDQAKLDRQWIVRLYSLLEFFSTATQVLALLLGLAVLLIIGNTLRLTLHTRQEEIQVLKLIGASNSFIMRPFLYYGVLFGFMGAVFAIVLVDLFSLSLASVIAGLAEAYQISAPKLTLSLEESLEVVMLAAFLGLFSARLSLKNQLDSIEP